MEKQNLRLEVCEWCGSNFFFFWVFVLNGNFFSDSAAVGFIIQILAFQHSLLQNRIQHIGSKAFRSACKSIIFVLLLECVANLILLARLTQQINKETRMGYTNEILYPIRLSIPNISFYCTQNHVEQYFMS